MPSLNWIGKDKVINHHLNVPYRVLNKKYSYNTNTDSENKIIQGDNLEALKSLLPQYEGKISCIYIDPPYNTGNENWIYNDNVSDPKIKKWLGEVVGKESEDLTRHDKWLCMMYPRLILLKKLMKSDGCLVISISFHEVFNLMPVLYEIFRDKQIGCVTVQTSGGKPSGAFNYQHEYLIFVLPKNFEANPLSFAGGKNRSPFEGLTLATFNKVQRPNQFYPIFISLKNNNIVGVGLSLQERVKQSLHQGPLEDFDYKTASECPKDCVAIWPITSKGKECIWRLKPDRLISDWKKGYIKISKNRQKGAENLYSIQYLPEGIIKKIRSNDLEVLGTEPGSPTFLFGENLTVGNDIPTLWLEKEFYSVKGTTLLQSIFGSTKFDYPKPVTLIKEIISSLTSSEDLILDSFAGSGSTGHAVLDLNREDGGNRRFILVEMEDYVEDITAARIKHVIDGYGEDKNKSEGTGGNFTCYKLGEPLFMPDQMLNEQVALTEIHRYIWYTETAQPFSAQYSGAHSYLLGQYQGVSYYFYYENNSLTTLNFEFLSTIEQPSDTYVIYADNCILSKDYMSKKNIIFKKIPRDITRF